jgi:glycosyltransferase involved in cell wall biosynthesis
VSASGGPGGLGRGSGGPGGSGGSGLGPGGPGLGSGGSGGPGGSGGSGLGSGGSGGSGRGPGGPGGSGRRLAFVTPRFGAEIVGGSEAVMREMALGLAARGWSIDILTTCSVDHHTWLSTLPAGVSEEEGLTVRRFETVPNHTRTGERVHSAIYHGRPATVDEQVSWLSFPFRVPDLFSYLLAEGPAYSIVIFSPYLFWTTTVCMPVVAERAVVVPCLHDEVYARLEVIRPVLGQPASVWFLSEPEHQLAHRLGPVAPRHTVTGAGLEFPTGYDPDGFRSRHGLERPFILYAGRRERDKGWDWLLETYACALDSDDAGLDLVTVGGGTVVIPRRLEDRLRGRVIDLGFVSTEDRDSAFAAAAACVQPSLMESFSRSVMESWLAGRPVLARAGGEVVAWHCEQSGGGRLFGDGAELAALMRWLHDDPDQATSAAAAGRQYVVENFSWPAVLDRIEAELAGFPAV